MKYKKTIILLVLAVFLLSITCVSASEIDNTIASEDANTIELSTDNDITEDNIQTSEENDKLTLTDNDETLSAKNDTDVLSDNSGTYSGLSAEISSGGNIELQHDYYTYDTGNTISIIVPDSVIDGKGATIDMAGSNIPAFYVSASGVTIKNLTIINANYDGDGGAIYFGGSGTVTNCNFTDNTADKGGAVYFSSNGNVTNCNFTGNTATGDYGLGGAVYFSYYGGTVSNCNFTDNSATLNGGAVYFVDQGTVSNCNFTDNTATYGGGAIRMYFGTVTNCNFTGNTASGYGGAINMDSGTVLNCNFTNNTGGAISMYSGTVTNCNFANNHASGGGGAINMGSGTVSNCNFINNKATGTVYGGGAVYFSGTGNVLNCNFTGNTATGDYRYGGAVYFSGTGNVTNCNFTNNKVTDYSSGGAVYFSHNGTVTNCNFINNKANSGWRGGGAAVYFNMNGTVTNCNFTNNKVTGEFGSGGAIYFYGNGTVTDCYFADNSADYGGGIKFDYGPFSITNEIRNCNFINNKARYEGGAIRFKYEGIVTNSNFTDNSAYNGGAIEFSALYINDRGLSFTDTCSTSVVVNCNFVNNRANGDSPVGGAINFGAIGDMANCNFVNNSAYYGGAISFVSGEMTNCNFTDNSAYAGGAIFGMKYGAVKKSNFKDNFARFLPDIFIWSSDLINLADAKVKLSKTVFIYNGKVHKPTVTITLNNTVLQEDVEYYLKWSASSPKKAGTYKIEIFGEWIFDGTIKVTFKINKADNPLKIKAKTANVKFSKLKKKTQVLKVSSVVKFSNKGQGTLTYNKVSGNKNIAINKKTGKVTIKKGLKKGTYKVKVKIKAKGNSNYKASSFKTVTFNIKIK